MKKVMKFDSENFKYIKLYIKMQSNDCIFCYNFNILNFFNLQTITLNLISKFPYRVKHLGVEFYSYHLFLKPFYNLF